jgi:hypothetical protein
MFGALLPKQVSSMLPDWTLQQAHHVHICLAAYLHQWGLSAYATMALDIGKSHIDHEWKMEIPTINISSLRCPSFVFHALSHGFVHV